MDIINSISTNKYVQESKRIFTFKSGAPQTLRKLIVFLAFVCLILDIVIVSTRPGGLPPIGQSIGTFLPDLLAIVMFTKFVINGLGRYPRKTRTILFTSLLIDGLFWPIVSFQETESVYSSEGQYWRENGITQPDVFFVTTLFSSQVSPDTPKYIHVVRSRDLLCLFYLLLAGVEFFRSMRLFRKTTAIDAEKGEAKAGSAPVVDDYDEDEIVMAPEDQKVDVDKDGKNEYEAEDVGK
ncbi:hypothetical protein CPC16_011447 [Podila verticillata]|nr:hypothetical protein BGZ59_003725 [Podila verticillata]KAF9378142.1 hypothetical protein CPC16_011447 [Podila verticillata]KFH73218.1 hypothetical protein MVEG_00439 [Podila verticillata NRRL 6337]